MFPWENYSVVRMIHEERIREALGQRPRWVFPAVWPVRAPLSARVSDKLRVSVAHALRRVAAIVEPSGSGSLAKANLASRGR